MSPPRPRFTVRRLMVAVALVAILLGAGLQLEQLRDRYRAEALQYAQMEWVARATAWSRVRYVCDAVRNERRARHYGALKRKYDFASRYPWLPLTADPPAPE